MKMNRKLPSWTVHLQILGLTHKPEQPSEMQQ